MMRLKELTIKLRVDEYVEFDDLENALLKIPGVWEART